MALLKIVKGDCEKLRTVCRPVEVITPRIRQLLDDMLETMRNNNGCGLAAPQVGVLRRIAVVETEENSPIFLINPKIIKKSKELQHDVEGCLSLPDLWGTTTRPETVTVAAVGTDGKAFTVTGSGLAARAFCHEIDHLDGILFTDNAENITKADKE